MPTCGQGVRGRVRGLAPVVGLVIASGQGDVPDEVGGLVGVPAGPEQATPEREGSLVATPRRRPVPGEQRTGGEPGHRPLQHLGIDDGGLTILGPGDRLTQGMDRGGHEGLDAGRPEFDKHRPVVA